MSSRQILNLPKHKNPVDANGRLKPNRTASAPYNFVPLPEVVVTAVDNAEQLPNHDTYVNNGYPYTGYFEVTLTTQSPVYVRCPFARNEFDLDEQDKDRNGRKVGNQTRYADRIKNTSHFFYTRDPNQPIIPGSSLRGMLRSVLEIVSYGKMEWVTDKKLIYRAVGDSTALGSWYREQTLGANQTSRPNMKFDYPSLNLKGGYLCHHKGEWAIRPARQHFGETFVHVEYSAAERIIGGQGRQRVHKVFVQPVARISSNRGRRGPGNLTLNLAATSGIAPLTANATAPAAMVPAVVVESGHMGRPPGRPPVPHQKHMHCAIYEPDPSATPIPIPQRMWEAYEEDSEMTRGAQTQTRKLNADGDPLFYLLDASGRLVFFGPTMMFRLPYQRSIYNLIPEPLRQLLDVDYANALFGFVRKKEDFPSGTLPPQGKKDRAYAARVFVTDAMLTREFTPQDLWLTGGATRVITPKILATPKPTSFQHYLVQPEEERLDLSHYDSPKVDEEGNLRGHKSVSRGHKRYWHQGLNPDEGLTLDQIHEQIEDEKARLGQLVATSTQHTQFKPVKPGAKFTFRVYFENLSDRELGALCWTLHPLGDPARKYCHHLGMDKQLGMGAVKLEATLYPTNRPTRYSSLFDGDTWQTGTTGSGESLTDGATLEKRTREFEQHILEVLGLNTSCQHLSEVKRIGMLLKMMEWPGFRAVPPINGQPAPNNVVITDDNGISRPNTRYMMIELPGVHSSQRNEYRDRPVLPDPCAFDPSIRQLAEPSSSASSSPTSGELPQPSTPGQPGSLPSVPSPSKTAPKSSSKIRKPKPEQARATTKKEWVILTEDVKGGKAKVQTEEIEIIVCSNFPPYPNGTPGMRCRAEVTREDGKAKRAIFKGWR